MYVRCIVGRAVEKIQHLSTMELVPGNATNNILMELIHPTAGGQS